MTFLRVLLESDGCFAASRETLLQDADTCQELDELGLPVIGGRALRGLLVEEVGIVLSALRGLPEGKTYEAAAQELFGSPGQVAPGRLAVGDARYPEEARSVLADAVATEPGLRLLAARSHTVLRRQTSIHEQTGAAATGSLRATRLVRKGTMLYSRLLFDGTAFGQATQCGVTHKALVAMAVRLLRRGGVHRSRGWGQISVELLDGGRSETSGGPVGETWSAPLLQRLAKGVDR